MFNEQIGLRNIGSLKSSVKNIAFNSNVNIEFKPNDIVVIVGPNGSGKSATLKGISSFISHGDTKRLIAPVTSVTIDYQGTKDDFENMILSSITPAESGYLSYRRDGSTHTSHLGGMWGSKKFKVFADFLCRQVTTIERLTAADPVKRIRVTSKPYVPIQYMTTDDNFEKRISSLFREAFGNDLIVNHGAGEDIVLHVGKRPVCNDGSDRVSRRYVEMVEN
ncbi:ATP-binding cassette domain-containing protein [Gemmata massiliana]|uniref:ATP-binding cassette domain-containing protein n=1 Tax=Gemmata massiliana TaxID=1210884 RepID=UPI0013A70950